MAKKIVRRKLRLKKKINKKSHPHASAHARLQSVVVSKDPFIDNVVEELGKSMGLGDDAYEILCEIYDRIGLTVRGLTYGEPKLYEAVGAYLHRPVSRGKPYPSPVKLSYRSHSPASAAMLCYTHVIAYYGVAL